MRPNIRRHLIPGCVYLVLANLGPGLALHADEEKPVAETSLAEPLFQRGHYEVTLNNGVLFSPFVADTHRPTINYTLSELQLGYMLSGAKGSGLIRGNFELAGAAFGGEVFMGEGQTVAGATAWLRYNFVQPNCRWVPYVQGGAGLTYADVDRRVVGEDFNFNLNLGAGVRYLFTRHWSLSVEYRYQHISNANLNRKNLGVNADGPVLGVSYFF